MVEVAAGPSDSAIHEKVSPSNPVLLLPPESSSSCQMGGKQLSDSDVCLSPAPHGAQSAEVKLLPSGSVRPALLPPGFWGHLSTR